MYLALVAVIAIGVPAAAGIATIIQDRHYRNRKNRT